MFTPAHLILKYHRLSPAEYSMNGYSITFICLNKYLFCNRLDLRPLLKMLRYLSASQSCRSSGQSALQSRNDLQDPTGVLEDNSVETWRKIFQPPSD